MHRLKKRLTIVAVTLISLVLSSAIIIVHQAPAAQPSPRPGLYLGAVSCASGNCHGNAKPKNPAEKNFRVRLDEYFTWIRFDRHAKAYNVLLDDKAKDIVRHLGQFKNQKPHEIQLCLNCHALPKDAAAKSLDLSQGVSCESCHGPASGWLTTHLEAKPATRAQSLKAGMIDVWSPKARAEQCLGCHLGEAGKPDKSVDHELIAAGHPDLRFELDNYSDRMPRHWASYAERADKAGREETEGARAWIIGQAAAFKLGIARLAQRARQESWPEYAELDCYACHHSLQEKSWRQATAKKDGLGLPPWSRARFAMMRHIVAVFAGDSLRAVEAEANKLSTAIHGNDSAKVAEAAAGLEKAMAPALAQIDLSLAKSKTVEVKQARQFIDLIVKDAALVTSDIRTAEQAMLAVNTLATDVYRSAPQNRAELEKALDALAKTVDSPSTYTAGNFLANIKRVQEILSRQGSAK